MNNTWKNGIATGDPVEAVAKGVVKAATDAAPRIRYNAGKRSGRFRFTRRYIPEKIFERSFRTQMKVTD